MIHIQTSFVEDLPEIDTAKTKSLRGIGWNSSTSHCMYMYGRLLCMCLRSCITVSHEGENNLQQD